MIIINGKKSEETKKQLQKIKRIKSEYTLVEEGKMPYKKWSSDLERELDELRNQSSKYGMSYTISKNGRTYTKDFLKGYGKEITSAFIKDLGYDEKTVSEFTNRILKSKRKQIN